MAYGLSSRLPPQEAPIVASVVKGIEFPFAL